MLLTITIDTDRVAEYAGDRTLAEVVEDVRAHAHTGGRIVWVGSANVGTIDAHRPTPPRHLKHAD